MPNRELRRKRQTTRELLDRAKEAIRNSREYLAEFRDIRRRFRKSKDQFLPYHHLEEDADVGHGSR